MVCCGVLDSAILIFFPLVVASLVVAILGPVVGFFAFKRLLDDDSITDWRSVSWRPLRLNVCFISARDDIPTLTLSESGILSEIECMAC